MTTKDRGGPVVTAVAKETVAPGVKTRAERAELREILVPEYPWRAAALMSVTIEALDALDTAVARVERLEEALRAARVPIADWADPMQMYGFFHGDDPREFHPDEEVCSAEELAAHKAACEAWDRGERPEIKKSGRVETVAVAERVNKDGETVPAHTANAIVCGGSFGMGTYTVRDPFLDALLIDIDAALTTTKPEPTNGKADDGMEQP